MKSIILPDKITYKMIILSSFFLFGFGVSFLLMAIDYGVFFANIASELFVAWFVFLTWPPIMMVIERVIVKIDPSMLQNSKSVKEDQK